MYKYVLVVIKSDYDFLFAESAECNGLCACNSFFKTYC